MIFNLDSGGTISTSTIVFNGAKVFTQSGDDWELALTESGSLQFLAYPGLVDIALIAGGMPGDIGTNGLGGVGGDGGGVVVATARLRRGVVYTIVVGGSGQNTMLVGSDGTEFIAFSGDGADGGTPSSSRYVAPVDGGDGVEIWAGEHLISALNGVKFGPGGGAGGYCSSDYAYYSPSNGGATGAPDGGTATAGGGTNPIVGTAGYGCGGGGAWKNDAIGSNGAVGLGSSGQILIRKHREAS